MHQFEVVLAREQSGNDDSTASNAGFFWATLYVRTGWEGRAVCVVRTSCTREDGQSWMCGMKIGLILTHVATLCIY